jgi:hypothetical protein
MKTAFVELLYLPDCSHAAGARAQLTRAFANIGVFHFWNEVNLSAPGTLKCVRDYGSPTILVNGIKVTGAPPGDGSSCRIYTTSKALGAPPLDPILARIRAPY